MSFGTLVDHPTPWPFTQSPRSGNLGVNTPLYSVALQWLKEDREKRRQMEKQGKKRRGARKDTVSFL